MYYHKKDIEFILNKYYYLFYLFWLWIIYGNFIIKIFINTFISLNFIIRLKNSIIFIIKIKFTCIIIKFIFLFYIFS